MQRKNAVVLLMITLVVAASMFASCKPVSGNTMNHIDNNDSRTNTLTNGLIESNYTENLWGETSEGIEQKMGKPDDTETEDDGEYIMTYYVDDFVREYSFYDDKLEAVYDSIFVDEGAEKALETFEALYLRNQQNFGDPWVLHRLDKDEYIRELSPGNLQQSSSNTKRLQDSNVFRAVWVNEGQILRIYVSGDTESEDHYWIMRYFKPDNQYAAFASETKLVAQKLAEDAGGFTQDIPYKSTMAQVKNMLGFEANSLLAAEYTDALHIAIDKKAQLYFSFENDKLYMVSYTQTLEEQDAKAWYETMTNTVTQKYGEPDFYAWRNTGNIDETDAISQDVTTEAMFDALTKNDTVFTDRVFENSYVGVQIAKNGELYDCSVYVETTESVENYSS